ncbi:site-specific integrase [Xylanimonas ulmi]|uniref:Site-specific recombinase XerD n=1 Tax=Xylanimonas ulmi TaxID=228973 RepID=A0A4Q7M584_9MICO|nr:site-specific integrase [Xylanibacterium ulmi]RZS62193.1 site-specific recombinase XerD [Xylanibacterium ulmi]
MKENAAQKSTPRRSRGEGGVYWNEKRQRFVATRVVGYDDRGKEIRKTGYGKSRSAAIDAVRRLAREYERGLAPGADKVTVGDAVKDWLHYGQGQVDESTVKKLEYVSAHIEAGIGQVLLRKMTVKHVEKLLASLVDTHSTRTIAEVKGALNNAVKRAMARDQVDRNVVELVKPPRGRTGRKSKSLTEKQALDVLRLTKGHWMYAYIVVSMLSGVRTEEIRALTWDRVNLDANPVTVEVWRSVRKSGDTKTKKSRRTLAMPDLAAEALHRRHIEQSAARVKAGAAWQETGFVFTTTLGTPLDAANVRRGFRSALKLVPSVSPAEWTPRELRHSFVSLMSAGGAAVEQISHLVGHSDTSTTELIYRHDLRPVLQTGATFMNDFAPVAEVGPGWHMEPLFRMPGGGAPNEGVGSDP